MLGESRDCDSSFDIMINAGSNYPSSPSSAQASSTYNASAGARDGKEGNLVLNGVTCDVNIAFIKPPPVRKK